MIGLIADMVRGLVTRAQVTQAAISGRTLVQSEALGETLNAIELLLPPGYSAVPDAGADVVLFTVLGARDHVVALGGDTANADQIAGLAPGEFGLRNPRGNCQAIFRNSGTIELSGTLALTGSATVTGALTVSGNISSGENVTAVGTIQGGV